MLGLRARLRKLNGSGDRPAAIRRVLEEIGPERQAKQAALAQLNEDLREARLEGDAGRIREIKRKIEDVTEELMAIDLAEPPMRERLAAAEAKERREAEPGLVAEDQALFEAECAGLKALAEIDRKRSELRARSSNILGEARTNVLLPYRTYAGVHKREPIEDWIARNSVDLRMAEAMTRTPTADPAPPAPRSRLPHELAPHERAQPAVKTVISPAAPRTVISHAEPLPDDTRPLREGEVRCQCIQGGYPDAEGNQCQVGRRFPLARATAVQAMANRALIILEPDPFEPPPPAAKSTSARTEAT